MRKRVDSVLQARLAVFAKKYGRKAQRGVEPNDRRYDRKVAKLMKKLPPEKLSRLLHEDAGTEQPEENHAADTSGTRRNLRQQE